MNNKIFGVFFSKYFSISSDINETIFDSEYCCNNSFIFSFDNWKIYYIEEINKHLYEEPYFNIKYDKKKSYFHGSESKNIIKSIKSPKEKEYFYLSGLKDFIISNLEIYEIKF